MQQKRYSQLRCLNWFNAVLIGLIMSPPAGGQIVPDTSFSAESSILSPDGAITGGAIRGANLFHSFETFNVNAGQSVYFANPIGIANILGRITGSTLSEIDGTLGVAGTANLFLLNPNGFLFGPNAQLDLRGSFTASTANRFTFADGSVWGMTSTPPSQLLSLSVPVGVQAGDRPQGNVTNQAQLRLAAGQRLTLFGSTVTQTGTLTAPAGTLQILGDRVAVLDQARLDVSAAAGGGRILVGGGFQGDASVPSAQTTTLAPTTVLRADALSNGNGGEIIVWADETAYIHGRLSARGGAIAGNGGLIETSGKHTLNLTTTADASAINGQGGLWLIDPDSVSLVSDGTGSIGSSIVAVSNINSALNAGTSVTITTDEGASGGIFQFSGAPIRKTAGGPATLTLATDNSIALEAGITSTSGALTVVLQADRDRNGFGNVTVLDTLATQGGNISLQGASIKIEAPIIANSGSVLLQGFNVEIGGFTPGSVVARTLAVNAEQVDVFQESFLFATGLLVIEANRLRAVEPSGACSTCVPLPAVVANSINADVIANGQLSLAVAQIQGFTTNQQGSFQTLRNNASNDLGNSSNSGNATDFEGEAFESEEFEADEFIPFSDRQAAALPSYNLVSCRESDFIVSGRGGLPTSPSDLLTAQTPAIPWVINPTETSEQGSLPVAVPVSLTEAQGWMTDAAGNVVFVAPVAASPLPDPAALAPYRCSG
ncbi:MAG: two-partner secretion domain-containing protein [Almyronema sp.]